MESAASFTARVLARTGFTPAQIPDGEPDDMLRGSIVCRSPHGTVVLTDHIGQDDDGYDIYARAVMVERGALLPPAEPTATGLFGVDPVVRRATDAHDLYRIRGLEAPEWIAHGEFSGSASSVSIREAARRNGGAA